ncbi:MAG: MarR family transcriptional regulator [Bacteroidales bacterium]|jgi:MarR family transcriptional regulator for hemolysin|nr:MarR family transcriptional regulator [Bacteroidales bacterium]
MEDKYLSIMKFNKLMHDVFRIIKKRINETNQEDLKITPEQIGLLYAISIESEDVIQKDMAELMGKDKSAILRLIDTLEEKELIRRVVDKNDRRKNYLMITKQGDKVLKDYLAIVYKLMDELQTGISESDLIIYNKVLKRVMHNAENL